MATSTKETLKAGRRNLEVSNLDKVFYPASGFTKGDVIRYYLEVAPVLVPHLKDRPLTLKRYPDGVTGNFFYEKRCPPYRPDWMKTVTMRRKRDQKDIDFCVVTETAALIWTVNLGNLELHTSLAKGRDLTRPTSMVFDLDPGPPSDVVDCARVALWLKGLLEESGLELYCKTSGSKGLQLFVPLNTPVTFEDTGTFAHAVARYLERRHPDAVVSKMKKELREGKVLIDWSQNDDHKTTAAVYSLRAKERPTASTPVTWDEVAKALKKGDPAALTFEAPDVLKRVAKHGDLFEPVLKRKQKLPDPPNPDDA